VDFGIIPGIAASRHSRRRTAQSPFNHRLTSPVFCVSMEHRECGMFVADFFCEIVSSRAVDLGFKSETF